MVGGLEDLVVARVLRGRGVEGFGERHGHVRGIVGVGAHDLRRRQVRPAATLEHVGCAAHEDLERRLEGSAGATTRDRLAHIECGGAQRIDDANVDGTATVVDRVVRSGACGRVHGADRPRDLDERPFPRRARRRPRAEDRRLQGWVS